MKRRADWVIAGGTRRGSVGTCTRCGTQLELVLPIDLSVAIAAMKAFVAVHRNCKEKGHK